jgi:hypothetical protein
MAGAAVGVVAAATWLGKRRLASVPSRAERTEPEGSGLIDLRTSGLRERGSADLLELELDELIEPEGAELPLGRSADPQIDYSLSRAKLPQDETSGAALLTFERRFPDESPTDASLDEVWNSLPGIAQGEQSEGYDAVSPEDLGSVWLERATQTTREDRPHGSDPNEMPELENLLVSEATLTGSRLEDEDEDEDDDDEISEDELDEKR